MAKINPDRIILKSGPQPIHTELPLEALAITPGMLIERTASNTYQPHSSAAGQASPIFAEEGLAIDPSSKTMGGIDAAYDQDNQAVLGATCRSGDHVYALLAAGEDTGGVGTLLSSNGNGYLKVGTTNPVARSLEDVDNAPGTGGAAVRVKVEVI